MEYVHNLIHARELRASDIVCTHLYKIYGEDALKLVDAKLLKLMNYLITVALKDYYILINNYKGNDIMHMQKYPEVHYYEERGMRCNLCRSTMTRTRQNELTLEPHILGKAVDFTVYDKRLIDGATVIEALTTYNDNDQPEEHAGGEYAYYFDSEGIDNEDDVAGFIATLEQAQVKEVIIESEDGEEKVMSIHDLIANSIIACDPQIKCRIDYANNHWIHLDVLNMLGSRSLVMKMGKDADPEIIAEDIEFQSIDLERRLSYAAQANAWITQNITYDFKAPTGNELVPPKEDNKSNQIQIFKTLFGRSMTHSPSRDSENFIRQYIIPVRVRVRRRANGPITTVILMLHKSVAMNYVNAFEDLLSIDGFYVGEGLHGYSYRLVPGTSRLSNHSYGLAIDLNVAANPWVNGQKAPLTGNKANPIRCRSFDHPVVQAFARHGIGWGGAYGDYMHFSILYGH